MTVSARDQLAWLAVAWRVIARIDGGVVRRRADRQAFAERQDVGVQVCLRGRTRINRVQLAFLRVAEVRGERERTEQLCVASPDAQHAVHGTTRAKNSRVVERASPFTLCASVASETRIDFRAVLEEAFEQRTRLVEVVP